MGFLEKLIGISKSNTVTHHASAEQQEERKPIRIVVGINERTNVVTIGMNYETGEPEIQEIQSGSDDPIHLRRIRDAKIAQMRSMYPYALVMTTEQWKQEVSDRIRQTQKAFEARQRATGASQEHHENINVVGVVFWVPAMVNALDYRVIYRDGTEGPVESQALLEMGESTAMKTWRAGLLQRYPNLRPEDIRVKE